LFACLLLWAGCEVGDEFICDSNAQCIRRGVVGICEPDRHCSFPDNFCFSGRRYGSLSGDRADECVALLSTSDADEPRDLSAAADMSVSQDLSLADLAGADLTTPPDMAKCSGPIVFREVKSATLPDSGLTSISIAKPSANEGDLLLAGLTLGWFNNGSQPVYTAPAGWTLVRRSDSGDDGSMLVYYHYASPSDPAMFTWTSNTIVSGVGWISSYSGVLQTASPIDAEAGGSSLNIGPDFVTPNITTTVPNVMVVGSFGGRNSGSPTTWSARAGYTQRIAINNGNNRSGLSEDLIVPNPANGNAVGRVSNPQDLAVFHILALKPCP
jgi:hypothetical protein